MGFGLIILAAEFLLKSLFLSLYYAHYMLLQFRPVVTPASGNQTLDKRQEAIHRAKRKLVYYAWFIALTSMLIIPFPAYVVAASFFTTFVSFMIFDEMH